MTETPSRRRLSTLWRWLLGVGVSATALFLAVALSDRLGFEWSLLIFLLGLIVGPCLLAGLGAVSLRTVRYWAYSMLLLSTATVSAAALALRYHDTASIFLWLAALWTWGLAWGLLWSLALAIPAGFGLAIGVAVCRWRQDRLHALHPLAVYGALAALGWIVWTFAISGHL